MITSLLVDTAKEAFAELFQLLQDLGLPINHKKVCSPCRAMTFGEFG